MNYLKISNDYSYVIIVAKFQINSIIIFRGIKKVWRRGPTRPPPVQEG